MKLVIAWMIEKDEEVWPASAYSVRGIADEYVIIDGNHEPLDRPYSKELPAEVVTTIPHPFPHFDDGADGIQRNQYLEYVKENHEDAWCLVLDADEVVDDAQNVLEAVKQADELGLDAVSVHMRHFIGDLGHEDATQEEHYAPLRLFRVSSAQRYPEVEHATLVLDEDAKVGRTKAFTIWHINSARNLYRLRYKYHNNLQKSKSHNKPFLDWWFHTQAMGKYPTKEVDPAEIPEHLLEHFGLTPDWFYFQGREIEAKHFIDADHWNGHFKPGDALEIGCGLGHRVYAMKTVGIDAHGIEKSKWAVENCPTSNISPIAHGDITVNDSLQVFKKRYSLVVLYDVLEHLTKDELKTGLRNVHELTKINGHVLISVPFEGDPNLYNDPTHKIFEEREWWEHQVEAAGFELQEVPQHFLFKHQLMIAKKTP